MRTCERQGRSLRFPRRVLAFAVVPLAILLSATPALAASGELDRSFSGDGVQLIDFGHGSVLVASPDDDLSNPTAALARNGDIVLATDASDPDFATDAIVARFTAAGKVRRTFGGGDGWRKYDVAPVDLPMFIVPLDGGQFVVGGFVGPGFFVHDADSEVFLLALRADGSRWKQFGRNGLVRTGLGYRNDVTALTAVANGARLIVAGSARRDVLVAAFQLDND